MTKQEFLNMCLASYGISPDYPFEDDFETAVLRHGDNQKWFALVMHISRRKFGFDSDELIDVVNLKMPVEMFGSFGADDGVYPAYHMNKLHWISVLLPDAPDDVVSFLTNVSFEATKSKTKSRKRKNVLNITNGDAFNEYFLSKFGGKALPFREAMMDGKSVSDIFSLEFIDLRSAELNISAEEYRSDMLIYDALNNDCYSELDLWFGMDTFCQMNLLTLLAYLEQIQFKGRVILNYIDDESFEVIKPDISIKLGRYKKIYESVLIRKKMPRSFAALDPGAVELYFDYHSDKGALAGLVRDNSDKEYMKLMCLLLENSKEYGLSDIQAKKLIEKYKRN